MKISGFIKNSLIDYPGKIASVIFTQGCNMQCKFCHNDELIPFSKAASYFSEDEILSYLSKAKGFIDALVITGGEACLQVGLYNFIRKVKEIGLCVKLDTNGSNPKLLQELLSENLIDYVAMDVKTSLNLFNYQKLVGDQFTNKMMNEIKESISLLKSSTIDVEFRSTLIKTVHSKDSIIGLSAFLNTDRLFSLQSFSSEKVFDPTFKNLNSFSIKEMNEISELCKAYTPNIRVL